MSFFQYWDSRYKDKIVSQPSYLYNRNPNTWIDSFYTEMEPYCCEVKTNYRQVSNISRTVVGNKIVDHSDVVGASPAGAAPTTSSFST